MALKINEDSNKQIPNRMSISPTKTQKTNYKNIISTETINKFLNENKKI